MRRATVAASLAVLTSLAIAVEFSTPVSAALFDGPTAQARCEDAVAVYGAANTGEELSACQWDMRAIGATPAVLNWRDPVPGLMGLIPKPLGASYLAVKGRLAGKPAEA